MMTFNTQTPYCDTISVNKPITMAVASASSATSLVKPATNAKAPKKTRIARPMNSFMVFAQEYRKELRSKFPQTDNKEISKMLGQRWKSLSPDEKERYSEQAKQLAEQHKRDYPDWKFVRAPPRKGKGKAAKVAAAAIVPGSPKSFKSERMVPQLDSGTRRHSDQVMGAYQESQSGQGGVNIPTHQNVAPDSTTAQLQQLDQSQLMYQEQRLQQPPPLYIAPPPIGASATPSPNMFYNNNPSWRIPNWNVHMQQMSQPQTQLQDRLPNWSSSSLHIPTDHHQPQHHSQQQVPQHRTQHQNSHVHSHVDSQQHSQHHSQQQSQQQHSQQQHSQRQHSQHLHSQQHSQQQLHHSQQHSQQHSHHSQYAQPQESHHLQREQQLQQQQLQQQQLQQLQQRRRALQRAQQPSPQHSPNATPQLSHLAQGPQ